MKKQIPALLLCLTLTLSACGKQPAAPRQSSAPHGTIPPATAAVPAPTATPFPSTAADAQPAPVWETRKLALSPKADDGTLLLHSTMALPVVQNAAGIAAYAAVNAYYDGLAAVFEDDAAERRDWALDDYTAAQAGGLSFTPGQEEYTYEITRQTARYVSICRELYVSGGAPYPSTYRMAEQFDLNTGKQLVFADFFPDADGAIAAIRPLLLLPPTADMDIPADDVRAAFQPERFYLTDEGFVFFFPGEDLGLTHGYLEIPIPYEELKEWSAPWIGA